MGKHPGKIFVNPGLPLIQSYMPHPPDNNQRSSIGSDPSINLSGNWDYTETSGWWPYHPSVTSLTLLQGRLWCIWLAMSGAEMRRVPKYACSVYIGGRGQWSILNLQTTNWSCSLGTVISNFKALTYQQVWNGLSFYPDIWQYITNTGTRVCGHI